VQSWSRNRCLPAPSAGIRRPNRCLRMPASSSMTARAAVHGSSPRRAIAACSVLTARCHAHRFRLTLVAVL